MFFSGSDVSARFPVSKNEFFFPPSSAGQTIPPTCIFRGARTFEPCLDEAERRITSRGCNSSLDARFERSVAVHVAVIPVVFSVVRENSLHCGKYRARILYPETRYGDGLSMAAWNAE